ncbi:dtd [Acrasis kona]|uniref:Dtd n=1 Tax=Acrasis kona TaxID=1008807 RepID=A0AAW2YS78_9EUKA
MDKKVTKPTSESRGPTSPQLSTYEQTRSPIKQLDTEYYDEGFKDYGDSDEDVPDFTNWSAPPITKPSSPIRQPIVPIENNNRFEEVDEDEDEEFEVPDYTEWNPKKKSFNTPLTQSEPIIPQSVNEDTNQDVKFIAEKLAKLQQNSEAKKNTFSLTNLLYKGIEEDDESDDEEVKNMSYDDWKKSKDQKSTDQPKQSKTFTSPLEMFDNLKNITNDLKRPMYPQMSKQEHEQFLRWMFPLCEFK